jgi:hypothetical protein
MDCPSSLCHHRLAAAKECSLQIVSNDDGMKASWMVMAVV